jgi:beta-galactosidase
VKASLEAAGVEKANGFDEIYAVDISSNKALPVSCIVLEDDDIIKNFLFKARGININSYSISSPETNVIVAGNYDFEKISATTIKDILDRVQKGTKLIVLENADKFAQQLNEVLKNRPAVYNEGGIIHWGESGRFFVGLSPMLTGLPQAQGMSWEYQCFYKGSAMGEASQVSGIRLNTWGSELVVALGNQGSKEILTALSRVPLGKGSITISTLNMLPNLANNELSAIVAKKLFLNLLEY